MKPMTSELSQILFHPVTKILESHAQRWRRNGNMVISDLLPKP
jgi:hypothetical protein